MSESAPGSPVHGGSSEGEEELYPLEGKFSSASDRDYILSLPEVERESILAARGDEALKRYQDVQLKRILAASKAHQKNKRKAAAADLDDGSRKNSRPKTEKAGRTALDDYKKARQARGAEKSSRSDAKGGRRRGSRSPSSASDRDADGESEVEWADTTSSRREEPSPDLKAFERCRVGRSNFAKVIFYPSFDDTMKGCYCRVSIGMNRETGQNMYRMALIKGFTEGKPYMLEAGPNAKSFMCDIYAVVAHGAAEKPWPLSACSDSRFTPEEFSRYIDTLQKERQRIPKKAFLEQKVDDINRFLNPAWTEDVLQQKFSKQRAMQKRLDPSNAAKSKRDAIMTRKAEAEDTGDEEEIARCDAELAALDNSNTNGSATKSTIRSSPSKPITMSHQDKLALLNQKNRGKNSEDVRKALLEERRKFHRERERAIAEAKAKQAVEDEAKRQKQQAALLGIPKDGADMRELFGDLSDLSRAGTPMSGVSTPKLRRSRQGTPAANGMPVAKSKLGLGAKKGQAGDEDELAGLDMGIDVEI